MDDWDKQMRECESTLVQLDIAIRDVKRNMTQLEKSAARLREVLTHSRRLAATAGMKDLPAGVVSLDQYRKQPTKRKHAR